MNSRNLVLINALVTVIWIYTATLALGHTPSVLKKFSVSFCS